MVPTAPPATLDPLIKHDAIYFSLAITEGPGWIDRTRRTVWFVFKHLRLAATSPLVWILMATYVFSAAFCSHASRAHEFDEGYGICSGPASFYFQQAASTCSWWHKPP